MGDFWFATLKALSRPFGKLFASSSDFLKFQVALLGGSESGGYANAYAGGSWTTPPTKSTHGIPVGHPRIMEGTAFLFIGNEKYAYARG